MINFDDLIKENIKENNLNWVQIHDHLYRISIIGGSGYGKTKSLFNIISHQPDINQIIYANQILYAKDPHAAIYQLLIKQGKCRFKAI